jgi:hypothetical protein
MGLSFEFVLGFLGGRSPDIAAQGCFHDADGM